MKRIKRACQFVPVATLALCMTTATAFAGRHGVRATAHGTSLSGKSIAETSLRMRRRHPDQSRNQRSDCLSRFGQGRHSGSKRGSHPPSRRRHGCPGC